MAEDMNTQGNPVIPEAVDGGGAEKELASDGYKREVAELGKLVEALRKENVRGEELEQRVQKQVDAIKAETEKNVKLGPDGTEKIGKAGVSWDDVMRLRTRNPEIREAQDLQNRVVDRAITLATMNGAVAPNSPVDVSRLPTELWSEVDRSDEVRELKARRQLAAGSWWDIETSSGGVEWRPTGFASTAVDFYFLDADVPRLFQQVTIPRGVGNFSIPIETTRAQADIEAGGTVASGDFLNTGIFSQAQTDTIDFTPKKHALGIGAEMSAVEDLSVDVVSRARMNVTQAMPRALTQSIINGQTASDATLDDAPAASGLISADGYSNAGGDNGLRLHCIVNSFTTSVGGNLDDSDFLVGREAMGDFGAREDELAMLTSGKGYIGLLSATNVLTVDKMGPNATILSGQLASVAGVPVLFTSEFPSDMAAGGIDAGTAATTGAVLVNHRRWYVATARNIEVTLLPQPGMDKINVIGRMRTDFSIAVVDEHSAHYFINVT